MIQPLLKQLKYIERQNEFVKKKLQKQMSQKENKIILEQEACVH